MDYREPYTVEDPDGNPIPVESNYVQHARDRDHSARNQPEWEEDFERGSRPTFPDQQGPRRRRTSSDSLGGQYQRDNFNHPEYSDGSDISSDSDLSDHEIHAVGPGRYLGPDEGFWNPYNLAKDFDFPKKKDSSSLHRRDDSEHAGRRAYGKGRGRIAFGGESVIPYNGDEHPFPREVHATRRHIQQDIEHARAIIRCHQGSGANRCQESRSRRDGTRDACAQSQQGIWRRRQGYRPDGKYQSCEESECYEENGVYINRKKTHVGGVDSKYAEEVDEVIEYSGTGSIRAISVTTKRSLRF